MHLKQVADKSLKRDFGPCHRCGWVMDVTKVTRAGARTLGVHAHARLCDECLADLRGSHVIAMDTAPTARSAAKVLHRRHVA